MSLSDQAIFGGLYSNPRLYPKKYSEMHFKVENAAIRYGKYAYMVKIG